MHHLTKTPIYVIMYCNLTRDINHIRLTIDRDFEVENIDK